MPVVFQMERWLTSTTIRMMSHLERSLVIIMGDLNIETPLGQLQRFAQPCEVN